MKWNVFKDVADNFESRLGLALARDDAELPIVDFVAAAEPFIGPGRDEKSGTPAGKNSSRLPFERASLGRLTMTKAGEANLSHHERALVRQILQASNVGLQLLLRLEINVKRNKIQKRKIEIFGRRIVYIRYETFGVFFFGGPIKPLEKFLNAAVTVPTNNGRRNFIADGIGEQRRMLIAGANGLADAPFESANAARFIEKCNVLFPGQANHHSQIVLEREIEQPTRRHGVSADRVDVAGGHERKVALDCLRIVIFGAVGVRLEWTVSDAADVKLFVPNENELSSDARTGWGTVSGRRGKDRFRNLRCRTGRRRWELFICERHGLRQHELESLFSLRKTN